MTSASRDGEILAQLVGRFGMGGGAWIELAAGSRALHQLVDLAQKGHDIAITPDGPRGASLRRDSRRVLTKRVYPLRCRILAQLSCVQMFDEAVELFIGVHEHFYQVGSLRRLRSVSPSETGR